MSRTTTPAEYQALAEFRFLIRRYLIHAEQAARSAGLEAQQYHGLLALRGLPDGERPTIRALAERLQICHHSAVELVDRMEKRGLLRRERSNEDRRRVLVYLTPRSEKLLRRLARLRIAELGVTGPALVRALGGVLHSAQNGYRGHRRAWRQNGGREPRPNLSPSSAPASASTAARTASSASA
jgi:DNA-binding MarR family transcriptional regulator